MSDCLQSHGLWLTRLLCPWNFPGKNTGVGCHFLLQGSNPGLLHCRQMPYPLSHTKNPGLGLGCPGAAVHTLRDLVRAQFSSQPYYPICELRSSSFYMLPRQDEVWKYKHLKYIFICVPCLMNHIFPQKTFFLKF